MLPLWIQRLCIGFDLLIALDNSTFSLPDYYIEWELGEHPLSDFLFRILKPPITWDSACTPKYFCPSWNIKTIFTWCFRSSWEHLLKVHPESKERKSNLELPPLQLWPLRSLRSCHRRKEQSRRCGFICICIWCYCILSPAFGWGQLNHATLSFLCLSSM